MRTIALVLLALAFSAPAHAVEWWDNWLSFVYDPASTVYDFNCMYQQVDEIIDLPLRLVRPINPDFGEGGERAVTSILGFDLEVGMSEGLTPIGWTLPVAGSLVVIDGRMSVRYDEPMPVDSERTVLATCTVYVGGITSFEIPPTIMARCVYHWNACTSILPLASGIVPGQVAYIDADDPVDPAVVPNTFGAQDLLFEIVESTVPATRASWSALRAAYR